MTDTQTVAATTLTIRRTFDAPRERVFDAFTNAETMKRWMGPPGTAVPDCSFNPVVGGEYRIVMTSPTYGEMIATGVVTALRRPEHLAYTWRWVEDTPEEEHDTQVRIDFIERGNQTEMVFVHEGFAGEESRDRHVHGWDASFDKLDAAI